MTLQARLHEPRLKKLAKIGFIIAVLVLLLYVSKLLYSIYYWSDPDRRYQPPEAWMTIGYIARSYSLNPHVLIEDFPYDLDQAKRKSLKEIAAMNKVPVETIINEINVRLADLGPQGE